MQRHLLVLKLSHVNLYLVFFSIFSLETLSSSETLFGVSVNIVCANELLSLLVSGFESSLYSSHLPCNDCVVGDVCIDTLVEAFQLNGLDGCSSAEKLVVLNNLITSSENASSSSFVLNHLVIPRLKQYKHSVQFPFAQFVLIHAWSYNERHKISKYVPRRTGRRTDHLFLKRYVLVDKAPADSQLLFAKNRILPIVVPLLQHKWFLEDFHDLWVELSNQSKAKEKKGLTP